MKTLKRWSLHRFSWFLLLLGSLSGIGFAYFVQVTTNDKPCLYCINDRYYLFYIAIAGLVGFLAPRFWLTRLAAIALFLYASVMGVINGVAHLDYLANPSPFKSCPMVADYLIPVQNWFPTIFSPLGNCNSAGPEFFGFNLVQLTMFLFVILAVIAFFVLFSQIFRVETRYGRDRNFFRK